jgi:flagellar biogenesis protein FliO
MSFAGLLVATSGSATAPDVSISHLLLQMAVAMVLVVGGIWGFGKLMGRSRAAGRTAGRAAGGLFRSRVRRGTAEDGLTVLSRQAVGKGKFLAVVQVGAQQFLVGIADSGLTPLGELRTPEPEPDEEPLPIAARREGAPAPEFGSAELAAMDLSALGVRSLDLGAPLVRVGGNAPRPPASRRPAGGTPVRRVAPEGRPASGATRQARSAAPQATVRRPAAAPPPPARAPQQSSRSVRSLVESLREATVRR